MHPELIYQLALADIPHIGYVHAKILIEHFGSARSVFSATQLELEKLEGIGEIRAKSIRRFRDFSRAEEEVKFIDKFGITACFISDETYPQRLLNCYDPPTMLFYKGSVSLNHSRMVAIVGTRNNTDYGKSITEKLIKKLSQFECVIVSGLAFGIDAIAHKCALKHGLPTIGVVGHGLDTIYPQEHTTLARQMIKNGGLLTEFKSQTKPDKHNFPSRNRVVAGTTDATIIVESGVKGGSMITAGIADSYNRDVFAVPGRLTDTKSSGCNELIRNNKAIVLTDPDQVIDILGWNNRNQRSRTKQKELFCELTEEEKKITNYLSDNGEASVDELNFKLAISSSLLAAGLLNLEMNSIVKSLPGKRFMLVD